MIKEKRSFMKANWKETATEEFLSDQSKGLPMPDLEKPAHEGAEVIDLPLFSEVELKLSDFKSLIENRRSRRAFNTKKLSLNELSYLLYMADGVQSVLGSGKATLRTVPSGGARHPFETYIAVNRVEGLAPGIYRYLAIENKLVFCHSVDNLEEQLTNATLGQKFCGSAPVTFIWACIPYRGEWRYNVRSHKVMLLDAGHICQNLYLAAESLEMGTCAIAAYDQEEMDKLIKVDGEDEYTVYMAPVGYPTNQL